MTLQEIEHILEKGIVLAGEAAGTHARAALQQQLLSPVYGISLYKQALISGIWYTFMNTESCQVHYKDIARTIHTIYNQ